MTTQNGESSQGAYKYDPDQDPDEKRQIRDGYRNQLRELEEQAKDFKNLDISTLIEGVQRADLSFTGVRAPQEAILDSRLLGQMSALASAKARDLKHDGGGFDVDEFLVRVSRFLGGRRLELEDANGSEDGYQGNDNLDWANFAREGLSWSHRAPMMDFMLGPLNLEQKKRTVTKRAKAEKINDDEKVKPHDVTAEELSGESGGDMKQVLDLGKLVEDIGPVSAFKLCINPESFPQSVENFFYLSFLIRDTKVALEPQGDDDLIVYSVDTPTQEEYEAGIAKSQCVLQINEQLWKDAIEAYDITEPLFPTRPVPDEHLYAFYGS